MSKVKTKRLRQLGIRSKPDIRRARKYILNFAKCNRGYGYNNMAFHLDKLDSFSVFSTSVLDKSPSNNE